MEAEQDPNKRGVGLEGLRIYQYNFDTRILSRSTGIEVVEEGAPKETGLSLAWAARLATALMG